MQIPARNAAPLVSPLPPWFKVETYICTDFLPTSFIPDHKNIPGNEAADEATKNAHLLRYRTLTPSSYEEIKNLANTAFKTKWKTEWLRSIQLTGKGQHQVSYKRQIFVCHEVLSGEALAASCQTPGSKLNNLFNTNSLQQHVNKPTRRSNIYDLVMTTPDLSVNELEVTDKINDHQIIDFTLEVQDPNAWTQHEQVLDYKRVNFELMKEELDFRNP
ncbi:hypothetical protein FHG87_012920 [Trinorchestia longiramus]|nr:hypothetical protein FHG87_012920 [Trinorchestia longiramus]